MLTHMETHQLRPVIDNSYDFDNSAQAFQDFSQGKHFGKVCINVMN